MKGLPYWGYQGPMGYEGHCESLIASGAMWDMVQGFVNRYGERAGWALGERIWYESLYQTDSAYQVVAGGQCNPNATVDGCGASNWYTVLLALDDDNGNLDDGTPNADIIWDSFNDHGIACGNTAPPSYQDLSWISHVLGPILESKVSLPWLPASINSLL